MAKAKENETLTGKELVDKLRPLFRNLENQHDPVGQMNAHKELLKVLGKEETDD